MSSAISLGVFCRLAPSTRAIMRSRNVSPGLAETRTISQSDRTRVPPVTLLRSPPLSRITGALSPVMALSSTEAMPSITSPSAGTWSPASTSTTSPLRSVVAEPRSRAGRRGVARSASWPSRRGGHCASASAWALPRPSAMASAKLANSTVNHSQARDRQDEYRPSLPSPSQDAWIHKRRGQHAADQHGEHHGIAQSGAAGSSLRNDSTDRPTHDRRIEQRPGLRLLRHVDTPSNGIAWSNVCRM